MMIDLAPNNPYGLSLRAPLLIAAGCLEYGIETARDIPLDGVGALVTRTTTLYPRRVAVPPAFHETPSGLLVHGVWPNPGLQVVLERFAPIWAAWKTPVLLSVAAPDANEFGQIAVRLEGAEGIAGLQLELAEHPDRVGACVSAVRRNTQLPILAHLPVRDPVPLLALARAALAGGADALVVGGPFPALAVGDSAAPTPAWLCGPATHPQALRLVAELAAAINAPLVGIGGVADLAGARRMLAVGAAAVQIGSALLADPWAAGRIAEALNI